MQTYLFAGFPRALNAMREWRRVSSDGRGARRKLARRREPTARRPARESMASMYDRLRENIRHLHPLLDDWMIDEGYGKVLSRPGLDLPRRELCIVAACAATGQDRQLHSHLARRAKRRRVGPRCRRGARRARRTCSARRACATSNSSGRGCAENEQRVHGPRRRERAGPAAAARASSRFGARSSFPWAAPTAATAVAAATSSCVGDSNLATLLDYTYRDSWQATAASTGRAQQDAAVRANDVIMPVPVGTVIRRPRHRGAPRRGARGRRATDRRARRARREGQRVLRHVHAPVAARISAGRRRRGAAASSSSSSSSPTSGSSASRTPASRRCCR